MKYLVIGTHWWNSGIFVTELKYLPGIWTFAYDLNGVTDYNPDMIFFLHWSKIVPDNIINKYECICFHPSDLPYGRGGTPIQNLIKEGRKETKLTAFRMTSELDAGPIYCQETLSLNGSLREIFTTEMVLAKRMITRIIMEHPEPVPQSGEVVTFKRRKPVDSEIGAIHNLELLYDHIRMLDAADYPRAYLNYNGLHFEFEEARLLEDAVLARVIITKED